MKKPSLFQKGTDLHKLNKLLTIKNTKWGDVWFLHSDSIIVATELISSTSSSMYHRPGIVIHSEKSSPLDKTKLNPSLTNPTDPTTQLHPWPILMQLPGSQQASLGHTSTVCDSPPNRVPTRRALAPTRKSECVVCQWTHRALWRSLGILALPWLVLLLLLMRSQALGSGKSTVPAHSIIFIQPENSHSQLSLCSINSS